MKKSLLCSLFGLGLLGCDSTYEGPCRTNADCASSAVALCDQTLALTCVSGECVEVCETELDCREDPLEPVDRRDCGGVNPNRFRVCENLRCAPGCLPEGMSGEGFQCPAGQACAADGRCALFAESFEPPMGEVSVSLPILRELCRTGGTDPETCSKWDDLPRAKRNTKSLISYSGLQGCNREQFGAEETCGGPAADGSFYLRLRRVPRSSRAPVFDYTCAACQCCAECRDNEFSNHRGGVCLGVPIPRLDEMCSPDKPACASVCADCATCPPVPVGERQRPTTEESTGLNQCQVVAAARTCPAWLDAENCRSAARAATCAAECPDPEQTPPACDACLKTECAAEDRTYRTCELAEMERGACPECTDIWGPLQDLCDSQGAQACVQGAVFVNRAILDEAEQALVSPVINLQGVAGDLRLSFQYIPFRIGATFFPVADEGPAPQLVQIAFCGGACENEASWIDSGVTLPTEGERNNGLAAGEHAARDWSVYGFDAAIPEALRTATFRFRLLPRLADEAVLGVDNVLVRTK